MTTYKAKQFDIEHPEPHGWIQWKGTAVCVDIKCECGHRSHFDGDFMYYIRCPKCSAVYECDGHIRLIRVAVEDESSIENQIDTAD